MQRGGVIFRQLQCLQSQTYTYLLGCPRTREALLIDPVLGNVDRDSALAAELDLKVVLTVETHVHADHVTGASALREKWGSRVAVPKKALVAGADVALAEGDTLRVGDTVELQCLETPGHTDACMSFFAPAGPWVFSGDALLIRGCGRTDFQSGSAPTLFRSIRQKLLSLPDETLVFPGHDYRGLTASSVREERLHNPRVGGEIAEHDFVGFMRNLNLPHPRQMAEAVPANMQCGRLQGAGATSVAPAAAGWGEERHLSRTLSGHFEVDGQWLEEHLGRCVVLDVRDADEVAAAGLGCIPGSRFVPLDWLQAELPALAREALPVIFVCRAGARSAQACVMLTKSGNAHCASLRQGLLQWNREGRAV